MTAIDIKTYLAEKIRAAKSDYSRDLDALGHEQLAASPGGQARSAYDFTYEVGFVNRRIAKRLRGETPEPFQQDGWITAPEEYRQKDRALQYAADSLDDVASALESLPAEDLRKAITLPSGQTTPLDLAFMCAYHTGYHDAQLNYLQAIHGDMDVHWEGA